MTLQESGEMYLKTILILEKSLGSVRAIDISKYMDFSKPSVSRAISKLKSKGYLDVDENHIITLTELGKSCAEKIYEKHLLFTKVLIRLGVEKGQAERDACRMEHYVSQESFNAIKHHVLSHSDFI